MYLPLNPTYRFIFKFTLIYIFLSVLVVISLCSKGSAETVVTEGLVSYWTFDRQDLVDNTVKDIWGKNDGTIVGDPKVVAGQVKDALEFDGSDDYVNLTNLGDFGSQIGASTFEAWVKTDFKKDWMTLFKVIGQDCTGWGMDFNAPVPPVNGVPFVGDAINLYIRHKVGERECNTSVSGRAFPISDGEWHHIIYVHELYVDEAEQGWRIKVIYIDGERHIFNRLTNTPKASFIPFTESIYLGAGNNHGGAERFFGGIIDEVRIYNRPLTDAEVLQNFESKTGLSVEPAQKLPTVWGALKAKL